MSSSEYEVEEADDNGLGLGNILAGVVIGVLVGGGLALLFAPKPGVELRGDLGDAVDDVRARAEQLIDDLQNTTQDLVTRSRSIVDQTRENLVRSVDAGREAYTQKKDELTAQFDS